MKSNFMVCLPRVSFSYQHGISEPDDLMIIKFHTQLELETLQTEVFVF